MTAPCECNPTAFPFFCERHRCEKHEHFLHLCRTRDNYRLAWDENRGPLQCGVRCWHRNAFEKCKYCASYNRRGITEQYAPWPVATLLAKVLADRHLSGTAVDMGCGVGAVGLAALSRECFVTFQDKDGTRVEMAATSARERGFQRAVHFDTLVSDFANLPPLKFDNIFASDINWNEKANASILRWVGDCWTQKGVGLFACSNPPELRNFAAKLPGTLKLSLTTIEDDMYAADLLEVAA